MSTFQELMSVIASFDGKGKTALPLIALDLMEAKELIGLVRAKTFGLRFYDALYPSTSDDPGAYFACLPLDNSSWQVTLGNHGWSGGIYRVPEDLIALQLSADPTLRRCPSGLPDIQIGEVPFFAHYKAMTPDESGAFCGKLRALHAMS